MVNDIELIDDCFNKKGIIPPNSLFTGGMNLIEVDQCLDVVSDILISEGFMEDDEPNAYGLILEDVIDFLLNIRYSIVD